MLSLNILTTFIKDNIKPIFYITLGVLWSWGCYNQGVRNVTADWKAANAKAEAKVLQDITDNKVLAATIKGENYVWKNGLDIEFNSANLVSSELGNQFGESTTTSGITGTPKGSGISPERTRIAEERKRIITEITGIRQTRNYLAREAKSNTKTLIDLQRFSEESK